MVMKSRLERVEAMVRECDPDARVMSRRLFDLAVCKFRRGLSKFGYNLTMDQVRRLTWWTRATDAGKNLFGRSNQATLLGEHSRDYGVENFDPNEFRVSNGQLVLPCKVSKEINVGESKDD